MKSRKKSMAEVLARAHATLQKDLQRLQEFAASECTRKEMVTRLRTTQTHITEHFRFEEQDGYMDAIRLREPHLERQVQHLAEEHMLLAGKINELLQHAEKETGNLDDPFRKEIQDWIEAVRRHEARENDLVQKFYNFDVEARD